MSTLYHFHANIFAAPPSESFACTWEDAATVLQRLPRMIFEPDGSFVYSGNLKRAGSSSTPANTTRWQVDGHLFDFAGRLYRMELHGNCPATAFDELLKCVGWPTQPLVFETVRDALTLDEATFRAHAGVFTPR